MDNKKGKLFIYGIGAIAIPYIYLFTVRPYLLKFENQLDSKITEISDSDLEKMKRKMEEIKKKKDN